MSSGGGGEDKWIGACVRACVCALALAAAAYLVFDSHCASDASLAGFCTLDPFGSAHSICSLRAQLDIM